MSERSMSCAACGETFLTQGNNTKWCSERCRKAQYDKKCIDCGARVNGTSPGKSGGRCVSCSHVVGGRVLSTLYRQRFRKRRETVERMWREGATTREIAKALGVRRFNPSQAREHGYDLPLRRTPEDIEKIVAGRKAARLRRAAK